MEWVENCLDQLQILLNPLRILTQSLSTEYFFKVRDTIWEKVSELPWELQMVLTVLACILLMTLTIKIYVKLTRVKCSPKIRLDGKTALITGANSGIGLETARDFAQRGARVILAVNNMSKGIEAARDIMRTTRSNNLVVRKLDLASLEEVRKFAQKINEAEQKLDILVLNSRLAGIHRKYLTEENLELHMVSNHFGHFLLTNLLLPLLCESSIIKDRPTTDPVRIVMVSSDTHWSGKIELDNLNSERQFNPKRIYSDTQLANLLFNYEMSRKLIKEGYKNIIVNAVQTSNHPVLKLLYNSTKVIIYSL